MSIKSNASKQLHSLFKRSKARRNSGRTQIDRRGQCGIEPLENAREALASAIMGTARAFFPSARELVRENRRNSQDRADAFPVDGALGWRLRLPD